MRDEARGPETTTPRFAVRPSARRWADLLPRAASALVMILLALLTAFVGGDAFTLFWLAGAAAIMWEWQHLVSGPRVTLRFAIGAAALAIAAPLLTRGHPDRGLVVLAIGLLGLGLAAPRSYRLVAAGGLVYAAALLVAVTVLRASFPGGLEAILWLFAVVWGTDIMAYFAGRLIGGAKLWPRLSPSKTWSGFAVGVVCGAGAGLLIKPVEAPVGPSLAIGLLAAIVAQGGDLFESWLKRRYGVKDASHLIPGHGGVMDRLDGFIAAAVFSLVVGAAHAGWGAAGAGLFRW